MNQSGEFTAGELRRKLQESLDDFERGDYIELTGDAAITRFVADYLQRSIDWAELRQAALPTPSPPPRSGA